MERAFFCHAEMNLRLLPYDELSLKKTQNKVVKIHKVSYSFCLGTQIEYYFINVVSSYQN